MTVKQAVKENKMISVILGLLASGLLAWGIWVTDAAYEIKYGRRLIESKAANEALRQDTEIKILCEDVFELRKSDIAIREEIKQQRDMIHTNHQELLRILINIQKKIRE